MPDPDRPARHALRLSLLAAVVAASLLSGAVVAAGAGAATRAATPARAASASAGASLRVVHYHGLKLSIPKSWPVFRLDRRPATCVRFDRHALYLGQPSTSQRCPAHAAGRTEALLVEPLLASATTARARATTAKATSDPLNLPAGADLSATGGTAAEIINSHRGLIFTATWASDPRMVERMLGYRSLGALRRASHSPQPRAAVISPDPEAHSASASVAHGDAAHAAAAATPGEVYTGRAFDACATPSAAQMSAWNSSPYRALGVYIGGANMACSQPNLTASWVSLETAAGWHLVPIYVGLQAPGNSCGCAAISSSTASAQGTAAAQDAIVQAQAIGLGAGNPLYYDMEGYARGATTSAAVLSFLSAWTTELHASGYKSGVYSSDDSGIADLVSEYGTGYAEPDDLWVANWNGQQTTSDAQVPAADWPSHQRLHQFQGSHNETYGGTTINIDGDYVDAATAAAGSFSGETATAPSLNIHPVADGTISLYPSWAGESGIVSWQILGGSSPSALAPVSAPVGVGAPQPISLRSEYAYLEVQAIGASGAPLGSSAPAAMPPHLAIFGRSAFVPVRGRGGLPVGCFGESACHVTTTIWSGRTIVAKTGSEHVSPAGGLTFFTLSSAFRAQLARASHHRLPVKVTVRDASGMSATRTVNLVAFTTSGRRPSHSLSPSPTLRLIGATDFVSHAWTGGILAGCFATSPCAGTATIWSGRSVIARARTQTIGAGELAYVFFTLTRAGHTLLSHRAGNQLPVSVSIATAQGTARGRIVLVAF